MWNKMILAGLLICQAAFSATNERDRRISQIDYVSKDIQNICFEVKRNEQLLTLLIISGYSSEDARKKSSLSLSFDQVKYGFAKSKGLFSDDQCIEFATTYQYVNETYFCQELRMIKAAELQECLESSPGLGSGGCSI